VGLYRRKIAAISAPVPKRSHVAWSQSISLAASRRR